MAGPAILLGLVDRAAGQRVRCEAHKARYVRGGGFAFAGGLVQFVMGAWPRIHVFGAGSRRMAGQTLPTQDRRSRVAGGANHQTVAMAHPP